MNKNIYFCNEMWDASSGTSFYVKLVTNKNLIKFSQFKNILELSFSLQLQGHFEIPPNMLLLNVQSNIGSFNNIILKLNKNNSTRKTYVASLFIDLNKTSIKENTFLEQMNFSVNLDVDKNIFNNSNLPFEFNNFYTDLLKIKLSETIYFNNYFPINKLTEFYISNKYKNDYLNLNELPNDLFSWTKNKSMNIYPEHWFNQIESFQKLKYNNTINKIYKSNVEYSSFEQSFENVSIFIKYYVDNKEKNLKLNFKNNSNNNLQKNTLFLNTKTIFNFNTKELYCSDEGVDGIYFPIPVHGNIDLVLTKNNINYKDNIPFSFTESFYSNQNKDMDIVLSTFSNVDGQWNELSYA